MSVLMLKIAVLTARVLTNPPPHNERKKHQAVLFSPGEFHTHPMVIPIQKKNPDSNGRRAVGNKGLWYEKRKGPPFISSFIN